MSTQYSAYILVIALAVCGVAGILVVAIGRRLRDSTQTYGEVPVQCRDGHVFVTTWIPGASFNAIRLGPIRFQYCPVGEHWTFVTRIQPRN